MSSAKRTAKDGFTLLEMMVALAIFALAALAMIRLQAYSVRSAGQIGESNMAWQVARNVAVEQLSNPAPPVIGEQRGEEVNGGRNWRWTATTSRTDDVRLVRMDIVVAESDAGARGKASLSIARPAEL